MKFLYVGLLTVCMAISGMAGDYVARLPITFSGYDKDETLTDFPVLVSLSTNIPLFRYSWFGSPADGADLRFMAADETTELNYTIASWNTNGVSYVWVQMPELSSSNDLIYAFFGNDSATAPAYTTNGATWSNGFEAVWQMQDTTNVLDSTGNGNHGTGTAGIGVAKGIAGQALSLNGSSHYVDCGTGLNMRQNDVTLSIWFKTSAAGTLSFGFLGKTIYGDTTRYGMFRSAANMTAMMDPGPNLLASHTWVYSDDQWHYATVTYDRDGDMTVYVDGIQRSAIDISAHAAFDMNTAHRFWIGAYGNSSGTAPQTGFYFPGLLDEARMLNVALSSNRVWAAWANQRPESDFLSYGTVQIIGGQLAVYLLAPTGIGLTNAMINGSLGGIGGGDNPDLYFCWGVADGSTGTTSAWDHVAFMGNEWEAGHAFSYAANGFLMGSTNVYRVFATNNTGSAWSDLGSVTNYNTISVEPVALGGEDIGIFSARLRGDVTDTGGMVPEVGFEWWATGGSVTSSVSLGLQSGAFSEMVSGLSRNQQYQFRVWASNAVAGRVVSTPAAFTTLDEDPRILTWNGSAGNDWSDPANWDNAAGTPPSYDDVVVINSGSVLLTNQTADLTALTITNATLTFSNGTAVLKAGNIQILDGAVLTHPVTDTNAIPGLTNRVHLVGTHVYMQTGSLVDTDGKGFIATGAGGQGPGAGRSGGSRGGGGGYGGRGGDGEYINNLYYGGISYGEAATPDWPGSGGGPGDNRIPGSGGGVIRIQAGHLILNGSLSADGGAGANSCGGGSGGSIWITCETFAATGGVISARGGARGGTGGAGGGGRIAIDHNALAREADVVIRTTPGLNTTWAGWFRRTTPPQVDPADFGTLYLSRTNGWMREVLSGLEDVQLVVPGFSSWSPVSLVVSNSRVRLPESFNLNVADSLHILANASLGLSNGTLVCGQDLTLDDGELWLVEPDGVMLGRDLVVTNGAELWLQCGVTNGTGNLYGLDVAIGGNLIVGPDSWIYPYSHPTDGGSVRWRAADAFIAAGGGMEATARGYGVPRLGNADGYGHGAGLFHVNRGSGGGYGGIGSWSYYTVWRVQGGGTYGVSNAPVQAGSGGGGSTGGVRIGGYGGGLIWLEVTNRVVLNGALRADGGNGGYNAGGGSGGGIFVACDEFEGAATGVFSVNGGLRGTSSQGGAGGGGRIAVAVGMSPANIQKLINEEPVANLTTYYDHGPYLGTIAVTNGLSPVGDGDTTKYSLPGTALFLTTVFNLTIQSDPEPFGSPLPDGYGTITTYAEGASVTNSVVSPTGEAAGLRRACFGWELRDSGGALLDSNTNHQAIFNLTQNLTLTWRWTNEYYLSVASAAGGSATVDQSGWYTNAVAVELTATPDPGYAFVEWTGDVPAVNKNDNPLTVMMDQPRAVQAQFASDLPMTRTWNGDGGWESTANWTPAGMPSVVDTAIIESGTVVLSSPRTVDTLVVSNGATVVFTNWSTTLTVSDTATILSNGMLRVAAPFTDSEMSNRVSLVCQDLQLVAGGTISADSAGYAGTTGDGIGEGRGLRGARSSGAGHGGHGGDSGALVSYIRVDAGEAYGEADAPVTPGSSGGGYDATRIGGHGGGVIRLVAEAAVIDGLVTANGGPGGTWCGGGAGGSIYLSATNLQGSGLFSAQGGNGNNASGGGSGGRIAIHYETAGGSFPRANASGGTGAANGWIRWHLPPFMRPASVGSLFLSRTNGWLSSSLAGLDGVQLTVPGFTSWTVPSLSITNARVRLEPGFDLQVSGVLSLTGPNAVLVVEGDPGWRSGSLLIDGGLLVSLTSTQSWVQSGATLVNNGSWIVKSAPTNDPGGLFGTVVAVDGSLQVGSGCWVYPYSDGTNGGSAVFRVGSLQVADGGGFNADSRGYDGGYRIAGWGPGGGIEHANRGSGGGYGGVGGWSYWTSWLVAGGPVYGQTNAPFQPGSGGGGCTQPRQGGGSGGGLIRIETDGTMVIDGSLTANGGNGGGDSGGGSGGAITLISGGKFEGGASAQITANGGNGSNNQGGGGGGGLIGIWPRFPITALDSLISRSDDSLQFAVTTDAFAGNLEVNPGTGPALYPAERSAEPGSIRIFSFSFGSMILVR